jgi:hypothetical protein
VPQNSSAVPIPLSDPVLAALDAARERWLSTRDARGVRLFLLAAMRAIEK